MKPQTVGRVLGVGLRIAGRMAGQRLAGSNAAVAPVTVSGTGGPGTSQGSTRHTGRKAAAASAGVARGMGGFFKPFRKVGRSLFLEVSGAFFFLFVMVFGNWAWKLRTDYAHGPNHPKFLVYVALSLVFLYLTGSSFWRARKR